MHRLKLLQIFLPILWTINHPSKVTTQWVVAEGAEKISRFMGFDERGYLSENVYCRALHDIGKVAIKNEILENQKN